MRTQTIYFSMICASLVWVGSLLAGTTAAVAEVMVLANRTAHRVSVQIAFPGRAPWEVAIAPGESRPIFADGVTEIAFNTRTETARYTLDPGGVYFLGSKQDGTIDLGRIGLGDASTMVIPLPGSAETTPPATIPIKILVDDDEVTRRAVWEARLRKRVEAASKILHRHAMIQLKVVAADTWTTDNNENDFSATLKAFERDVDPYPGELAIGFSSQYQVVRGRVHLGGTRGPMRRHILLREWSRHVSETEKLELLLHELGHYLGAAHSPESDSVMRPVLGDRQSRRTDFVVKFDPVNTLLISMVGEEIRRGRVSSFAQISQPTKARLREIYKVLGQAQPSDPAARILTGQLGRARANDPLTKSTRDVLAHLTQAARTNHRLPEAALGRPGPHRVEGDELFDELVRMAAREALAAPEELQAKIFLLAIGIGIGDPEDLKQVPAVASTLRKLESPAERSIRTTYVGRPTVRGRYDLARHFTVAAMLVGTAGVDTAKTLSLAKEVLDSNGGTGFSFADLAADQAGIHFAQQLLDKKLSLAQVAQSFHGDRYMPDVANLPEGMTTMQFMRQYGGQNDPRFQKILSEIEEAITALPAYGGGDEPAASPPSSH